MKKLLFTILFIGIIGGGVTFGAKLGDVLPSSKGDQVLPARVETQEKNTSPTENPVAAPQTLRIPKINVQTTIESVGMDEQGRMAVPKDADNVSWYKPGYKPGEKGSAVLAGHFDKETGAPAVFWNVGKLTTGDKVIVTDVQGKEHTFAVIQTTKYPYNDFPLQKVFGASSEPMLNLITCQGAWNETTRNYSHRTVVYTQRVQ